MSTSYKCSRKYSETWITKKKSMFKEINGINMIWTLFNMKVYQKPCQSFDTYSFYVSMNQLKTNFKIQNKRSLIPTNHQWALKNN